MREPLQPSETEIIKEETTKEEEPYDLDRIPPRKLTDDLSGIIEDLIGGGE